MRQKGATFHVDSSGFTKVLSFSTNEQNLFPAQLYPKQIGSFYWNEIPPIPPRCFVSGSVVCVKQLKLCCKLIALSSRLKNMQN